MSIESRSPSVASKENNEPSQKELIFAAAKAELFRSFGWSIGTIESPESAPSVIDFAKFWKESGLSEGYRGKKIVFPRDHEIFVGINYKRGTKEIDVTELTVGERYEVTPEGLHFVEIHNEPDDETINGTGTKELFDNLPDAYFGDMSDFLHHDEVFCSVIIRMIDEKNAGIVMAIKTDKYNDRKFPLRAITNFYDRFLPKIQRTLEKDDVLIIKNGVAVYRGFVELPPKRGKNYLRLRKPD